jgi:hypothetical protein
MSLKVEAGRVALQGGVEGVAADPVVPKQSAAPVDSMGGKAEVPAALLKLSQRQVETSAAADAALCRYYGVPETKRDGFWGEIRLFEDKSPVVATAGAAAAGTSGAKLVTDIRQLVDNMESSAALVMNHLHSLGWAKDAELDWLMVATGGTPEGYRAAKRHLDDPNKKIEMKLTATDYEGLDRLGGNSLAAKAMNVIDAMKERKLPKKAEFTRTLQTVSISREDGKISDIYLMTYSWPPRGLPGVIEEKIHYRAKDGEIRRYVTSEALSNTLALSMGDAMRFYADKHADKDAKG